MTRQLSFLLRRVDLDLHPPILLRMIFKSPPWVPKLPPLPDSIPVSEFILNEKYGRRSLKDSRDPYTCGLTGKSYSTEQIRARRDDLAKSLREELGWQVSSGSAYEKVGVIFCLNTVSLEASKSHLVAKLII